MSAVPLSRRDGMPLNQKEREAVEVLLRCFRDRLTGSLEFDFTEGVPTRGRRTDVQRFGKGDLRPADT
jgi:hypothetical protein